LEVAEFKPPSPTTSDLGLIADLTFTAGRPERLCKPTNTPDHHFVLAAHPRHPEVVVTTGCSGHAFKFLPVIGEIVADLAFDGKTAHSVALFEPDRARSVRRRLTATFGGRG
jgi:glycine/D-amino acid oxidase-like deaminating enzyme